MSQLKKICVQILGGGEGRRPVGHRRRIYTEEKAKVVAAVWGTECIQFLATLAVLHQDDMKKRMNSSYL